MVTPCSRATALSAAMHEAASVAERPLVGSSQNITCTQSFIWGAQAQAARIDAGHRLFRRAQRLCEGQPPPLASRDTAHGCVADAAVGDVEQPHPPEEVLLQKFMSRRSRVVQQIPATGVGRRRPPWPLVPPSPRPQRCPAAVGVRAPSPSPPPRARCSARASCRPARSRPPRAARCHRRDGRR